jgi:hypothetical protein
LQEQPRPQDKDHHTQREPGYLIWTTSFQAISISHLCASSVILRLRSPFIFVAANFRHPDRLAICATPTRESTQSHHRNCYALAHPKFHSDEQSLHLIDAYSTQPANANIAKAQFSAR